MYGNNTVSIKGLSPWRQPFYLAVLAKLRSLGRDSRNPGASKLFEVFQACGANTLVLKKHHAVHLSAKNAAGYVFL